MQTLNEGGCIPLWSGWLIDLPPACCDRNDDGSWSAWGADWTLDVTIVDTAGDAHGNPVTPAQLLGEQGSLHGIEGQGWIGSKAQFEEVQNGRTVHRLSGKLCAYNTVMLCTISFFDAEQVVFANSLFAGIEHVTGDGAEPNAV